MTKRHLLKAGIGRSRRAACGLMNPVRLTEDPSEVTCLSCKGSLFMADVEIRLTNPASKSRRSSMKRKENP